MYNVDDVDYQYLRAASAHFITLLITLWFDPSSEISGTIVVCIKILVFLFFATFNNSTVLVKIRRALKCYIALDGFLLKRHVDQECFQQW